MKDSPITFEELVSAKRKVKLTDKPKWVYVDGVLHNLKEDDDTNEKATKTPI